MCQFSFGFMNQQLTDSGISPMEMWLDPYKYAEGLLLLREHFQFDGILVSVFGHDVSWRSKLKKVESHHGYEVATFEDRQEFYPNDDLPYAEFFRRKYSDISAVDLNQIDDKITFLPASRECHAFINKRDPFLIFDLILDKLENRYAIHGEIISPFDYFLDLLGYENALLGLLIDPERCKRILQQFTDGIIQLIHGLCQKNIDAVKISSPFAGMGFISPYQYLEFEQPFISQLADAISSHEKYAYIHTCGHIGDRLEYMQQSGINGLECLDPPPIGNVDLEDAFKRIGSKLFIKGNLDPVNTLLNGSDEVIIADVKKRLKIGMKYPGFILSTACSIAPKTPAKNVLLLHEVVESNGYY